jgi:hypothetical protein
MKRIHLKNTIFVTLLSLSSTVNAGFTDNAKAALTTIKDTTTQGWIRVKSCVGPVQRDEKAKKAMRCENGLMTPGELREMQGYVERFQAEVDRLYKENLVAVDENISREHLEALIEANKAAMARTNAKLHSRTVINYMHSFRIEHPSYIKYGIAATATAVVTTVMTLAIKYRKRIKSRVISLFSKKQTI